MKKKSTRFSLLRWNNVSEERRLRLSECVDVCLHCHRWRVHRVTCVYRRRIYGDGAWYRSVFLSASVFTLNITIKQSSRSFRTCHTSNHIYVRTGIRLKNIHIFLAFAQTFATVAYAWAKQSYICISLKRMPVLMKMWLNVFWELWLYWVRYIAYGRINGTFFVQNNCSLRSSIAHGFNIEQQEIALYFLFSCRQVF